MTAKTLATKIQKPSAEYTKKETGGFVWGGKKKNTATRYNGRSKKNLRFSKYACCIRAGILLLRVRYTFSPKHNIGMIKKKKLRRCRSLVYYI